MTTITFHMEGGRIDRFEVRDHAGYDEEGYDILCAAVSSAVNLIDSVVNTVLGLSAAVKTNAENAFVSFQLPGGLSEKDEATCQNLMVGFMVYLTDLHQHYPDFIQVHVDEPDEKDD